MTVTTRIYTGVKKFDEYTAGHNARNEGVLDGIRRGLDPERRAADQRARKNLELAKEDLARCGGDLRKVHILRGKNVTFVFGKYHPVKNSDVSGNCSSKIRAFTVFVDMSPAARLKKHSFTIKYENPLLWWKEYGLPEKPYSGDVIREVVSPDVAKEIYGHLLGEVERKYPRLKKSRYLQAEQMGHSEKGLPVLIEYISGTSSDGKEAGLGLHDDQDEREIRAFISTHTADEVDTFGKAEKVRMYGVSYKEEDNRRNTLRGYLASKFGVPTDHVRVHYDEGDVSVLAPGTGPNDAQRSAERILDEFKRRAVPLYDLGFRVDDYRIGKPFTYGGKNHSSVTLSLGFDPEILGKGYSEWIRQVIVKDPSFLSSGAMATAPKEIRDEHPEAGADFGFFDAKANESLDFKGFLDRFRKKPARQWKFKVGDEVVIPGWDEVHDDWFDRNKCLDAAGTVVEIDPERDHPYKVKYSISPWSTPSDWYKAGELVEPQSYIREMIAEDPEFVKTEIFRRFASPDLKAKYPEAGADFGFFDAKNESLSPRVGRTKVPPVRQPKRSGREGVTVGTERGCRVWRKDGKVHRDDGPAVTYPNGRTEWWENGRIQRRDGPAVITKDGDQEWWDWGQKHRDNGPAAIKADGTREWYRNGRIHRDGGPAVERPDGTQFWYQNGRIHREDGPAIVMADGTRKWHQGNYWRGPHRDDGPAVERPNGTKEWYLNGREVDSEYEYARRAPKYREAYIRRRIAEDPSFAADPMFQGHAPRDLKDQHPEAGADFGFFDAKETRP